jgi:hypothetical protein
LALRVAALKDGTAVVRDTAALLGGMNTEVEIMRSEVLLLRNLITAKQLSLLHELRGLYPIATLQPGPRFTIRGLLLPDRDFHTLPEEQVSTALGYTCHLVSLLSKYLQVPLRYYPRHMASRSSLRDEVISNSVEYPLYWKGVVQDDFRVAVLMLHRDVKQLLNSQGLAVVEGHMLANVQRLFAVLLDTPLVAPDAMG